MQRGLHQGDPLSPFLFIIAIEALHVMMEEAAKKCLFHVPLVGCDGIQISHLQFADDALFFGNWSSYNVKNLLQLLSCFADASGLHINLHKSSLFGVGVSDTEVIRLASKCRCSVGLLPFSYLGLLVGHNMKLNKSWSPVEGKFTKRLNS